MNWLAPSVYWLPFQAKQVLRISLNYRLFFAITIPRRNLNRQVNPYLLGSPSSSSFLGKISFGSHHRSGRSGSAKHLSRPNFFCRNRRRKNEIRIGYAGRSFPGNFLILLSEFLSSVPDDFLIFTTFHLLTSSGYADRNKNSHFLTTKNCTFATNTASTGGGFFSLYSISLNNSSLWPNSGKESNGSFTGTGNLIGIDPHFVRNPSDGGDGWRYYPATTVDESANNDYGDLHLTNQSSAIDNGNNTQLPPDTQELDQDGDTSEPIPYDLAGNPRIFGTTVDCGAFEYEGDVAPGRETPSVVVTTDSDTFDMYEGLKNAGEPRPRTLAWLDLTGNRFPQRIVCAGVFFFFITRKQALLRAISTGPRERIGIIGVVPGSG